MRSCASYPSVPSLYLWPGLSSGAYAYTADVLTLAGMRAVSPAILGHAVSGWNNIQSPMSARVWEEHLADHPDRAYCKYLVEGLRYGFRIGFWHGQWLAEVPPLTCNQQMHTLRW